MSPVKVKAVRTQRNSSATPARSTSDDQWIWSALDIARRAAMANDLAHTTSIKGVADIFTRLLEQLHGVKRRDEFCMVTTEIGNLIELIVRYAREHDPVCERYKGVCDRFLSTVSSMESEMERIFRESRSPTHSPKAKAYQDILSSYQFPFRRLRSDLQALSPSPIMPSTGILSNCKGFVISGGTIAEVHGNQYIFNGHGTADIQTVPDQTSTDEGLARRIDDLDLSDYRGFKYGDLRAIDVPRRRLRITRLEDGYERDEVQEYAVFIQNQVMTARTYSGNSALQTFKNDVKMILGQNIRHRHIVQLFGTCTSSKVPTLIFHGDLRVLDMSIDTNLTPREHWLQLFRILEGFQAAFHYLIREHQIDLADCDFMTQEGQLRGVAADDYNLCCISHDISLSGCFCHVYLDNSQQIQVSIEPPLDRLTGFAEYHLFPKLSCRAIEVIKKALASNEVIPDTDAHQIDKKACLLAICSSMASRIHRHRIVHARCQILISPSRHAEAARLTFDREYGFWGSGWKPQTYLNMANITIDNISWTRFPISHCGFSSEQPMYHPTVWCSSSFKAPPLYLETWLAQTERIMSQAKLPCAGSSDHDHDMMLLTGAECTIFFQRSFSPPSPFQQTPDVVYLFVQDLRDIDDAFKIPWFWARDPKGLERLSPADILVLGLRDLRQSKIYVETQNAIQDIGRVLHPFYKAFGLAPDSLDIPRLLDLPIASLEWDGDNNGPLTPWELLTDDFGEYFQEQNRLQYEYAVDAFTCIPEHSVGLIADR